MDTSLLTIEDLHVDVQTRRGSDPLLEGVNLQVNRAETVGLVGESGSGKTMTCLAIMGSLPPGVTIRSGDIRFETRSIRSFTESDWRRFRGNEVAMILQDPMTSLNPVFRIGRQLDDLIRRHSRLEPKARSNRAQKLMMAVRLARNPSEAFARLRQYPGELSGGMRQRVVGAYALAGEPKLIIADEPTTALDLTTQLQYLNLLKEIQGSSGASLILVTHDFGVVAEFCERVAVLYAGEVVEVGPVAKVLNDPRHPYTEGLLRSVPTPGAQTKELYAIPGQPPSLSDRLPGCPFANRCPLVEARCQQTRPALTPFDSGRAVACWVRTAAMGPLREVKTDAP